MSTPDQQTNDDLRPGSSSVQMRAVPGGQALGLVSPRMRVEPAKEEPSELSSHLLEEAGQRLDQIADRLNEMLVTLENVRVSLENLTAASDDHEVRLRRLEGWKQRVHTLGTLLAFVMGAAVTAVAEGLLSR